VSKTKKQHDERLQEVRNPRSDKVQYRKRRIQEDEADKELKEYEDRRAERRTD
jgi:hypothetical protein